MATILEIAQEVSAELNIRIPTSLIGSGNAGWLQLFQLINTVAQEIHRKTNWQLCCRRVQWVSIAGEDQGDITVLCPLDMEYLVPRTFWDLTVRREIFGPISDVVHQQLKALVPSSPFYRFKVENNRLLVLGPMVVGHDLSIIYKTRYIGRAAALGAFRTRFVADTDVPFWSDELMTLGLKYRWRKAKQMAYTQEQKDFYLALDDAASINTIRQVIKMDDTTNQIKPGIWVPAGSWDLTTLP